MTLTPFQAEAQVLAYYEREVKGEVEMQALAGLGLDAFRSARTRLVSKGLLMVTMRGRYVPVDPLAVPDSIGAA